MSQYKTGTVSVTEASATVTGSGTLWSSVGVQAGWLFNLTGTDGWYYVSNVASNTSLTLTAPYGGSTVSGASYVIVRDYLTESGYSIPLLNPGDVNWTSLLNQALVTINNQLQILGTTGGVSYTRGANMLITGYLYAGKENVSSMLAPFSGTLSTIRAEVDNAPTGNDLVIDVLIDGTSIFSGDKLTVESGSTFSTEMTPSASMSRYSTISVNIDEVGTGVAGGRDLRIIMYFEGGEEDEETSSVRNLTHDDTPYEADIGDRTLCVDTSGGNFALSIPAPALTTGVPYRVKKNGSDLYTVTVTPASGTVDGSSSLVLRRPWESCLLISNGTLYNIY